MTIGVFPVPKDVRAARDFELWRGQDDLLRTPFPMEDPINDSLDPGEWVKLVTAGGVTKARKLEAGDDLAGPAVGARVCWTLYRPGGFSAGGQSDAMATHQVDTLTGAYQAKTKYYNTSGTYAPGFLLVAVYDAVLGGILDAIDPATVTAVQLHCVVGKVIEVADGRLLYECP